jgi:hypothetical protein
VCVFIYLFIYLFIGPYQGLLSANEESRRLVFRRCGEQKAGRDTETVAQTLGEE